MEIEEIRELAIALMNIINAGADQFDGDEEFVANAETELAELETLTPDLWSKLNRQP